MEKRVVVITGGATGIGFASSKKFAEKGDIVVIAGRRSDKGEAAVLRPEDVANVVYFLSTEESTIINGCDVSVDDGFAYFKDWKVV